MSPCHIELSGVLNRTVTPQIVAANPLEQKGVQAYRPCMISPELRNNLAESGRRSIATIWWLARIMIPASAAVFVLERTGVLASIAGVLEPTMSLIGLPGAAAMAVISSLFINLYAVIAMVPMLGLDQRQLVILALLCLVAHNYLVELAVTRRTGTPVGRMFAVRTLGGLLLAWVMSMILPQSGGWIEPIILPGTIDGNAALALGPALEAWLWGTIRLMARVTVIVTGLVFLTRWLQLVGVTDAIGRAIAYPLSLFGLPPSSGTAWIVANTLGLAYGAAVLQEEAESGRLDAADGDLLNHHLGVSHSLVEDTALFAALGAPAVWLILPRLAMALLVVWERRLERLVGLPTFRRHPAAPDSGR
jgi:spore maturation protein SpmB